MKDLYPDGWCNVEADNSLHCIPGNDLKPHWLDRNGTCWCHPTEDNERPDFWVHHSLDGREEYEEGRALH